jgi:hypothetical protein
MRSTTRETALQFIQEAKLPPLAESVPEAAAKDNPLQQAQVSDTTKIYHWYQSYLMLAAGGVLLNNQEHAAQAYRGLVTYNALRQARLRAQPGRRGGDRARNGTLTWRKIKPPSSAQMSFHFVSGVTNNVRI